MQFISFAFILSLCNILLVNVCVSSS